MKALCGRFVLLVLVPFLMLACQPEEVPLKYNYSPKARESEQLLTFDSCESLEESLKEVLREEMGAKVFKKKEKRGDIYGRYHKTSSLSFDELVAAVSEKPDAHSSFAVPLNSGLVDSSTDVADNFKKYGNNLLAINNGKIELFKINRPGKLKHKDTLTVDGQAENLLVWGQGMEVFIAVISRLFEPDRLKISIFTMSGTKKPVLQRELIVTGQLQAISQKDGFVRLVSFYRPEFSELNDILTIEYKGIKNLRKGTPKHTALLNEAVNSRMYDNNYVIDQLTLADFLPTAAIREGSGAWQQLNIAGEQCQNFQQSLDGVSRGVSTILSFKASESLINIKVNNVLTDSVTTYLADNQLFLAEPAEEEWWYTYYPDEMLATNIHAFVWNSVGDFLYGSSARLSGLVEKSADLSSWQNVLRVTSAATADAPTREIYIFETQAGQLKSLGPLKNVLTNEQLRGASFYKNRGYFYGAAGLVAIRDMDNSLASLPVASLPVADSSYLVPFDGDSMLLSVRFSSNEEWLNGQPEIALYPLADYAQPLAKQLLKSEILDTPWNIIPGSELQAHRYLQIFNNIVSLPITTMKYSYYDNDYHFTRLSMLLLLQVDNETSINRYGLIDHSSFLRHRDDLDHDYAIRRLFLINNYLYVISPAAITVHRFDDLTLSDQFVFQN